MLDHTATRHAGLALAAALLAAGAADAVTSHRPGGSGAAGQDDAPAVLDAFIGGLTPAEPEPSPSQHQMWELIVAWGTDDPALDENDDGVVDVLDLLERIATAPPRSGIAATLVEIPVDPDTVEQLVVHLGLDPDRADRDGDGIDAGDALRHLLRSGITDPPARQRLRLWGLLTYWGEPHAGYDADGSGAVDVGDLLEMLARSYAPQAAPADAVLFDLVMSYGQDVPKYDTDRNGRVDATDAFRAAAMSGSAISICPHRDRDLAGSPAAWSHDGACDRDDAPAPLEEIIAYAASGSFADPSPYREVRLWAMLASWGESAPGQDLNRDGVIDIRDLLMLLGRDFVPPIIDEEPPVYQPSRPAPRRDPAGASTDATIELIDRLIQAAGG